MRLKLRTSGSASVEVWVLSLGGVVADAAKGWRVGWWRQMEWRVEKWSHVATLHIVAKSGTSCRQILLFPLPFPISRACLNVPQPLAAVPSCAQLCAFTLVCPRGGAPDGAPQNERSGT